MVLMQTDQAKKMEGNHPPSARRNRCSLRVFSGNTFPSTLSVISSAGESSGSVAAQTLEEDICQAFDLPRGSQVQDGEPLDQDCKPSDDVSPESIQVVAI
jgi:hypothetical protein